MLTAGHAAPSVGHSQPWRFLVVDNADLRVRTAVMADTVRLDIGVSRRAVTWTRNKSGFCRYPIYNLILCYPSAQTCYGSACLAGTDRHCEGTGSA